jgi:hypothetical protein
VWPGEEATVINKIKVQGDSVQSVLKKLFQEGPYWFRNVHKKVTDAISNDHARKHVPIKRKRMILEVNAKKNVTKRTVVWI